MRRLFFLMCVGLCAGSYLAWPLYTAWTIKEAITTGDSAHIARHFDWDPVKKSLKQSMADMVLKPVDGNLTDKPHRKGLWASIKAYYSRNMINSIVDRYANPTGLPTLFSHGRTIRRNVLGRTDPDDGLPLGTRIANSWSRLDRAEFITLTRFEVDLRDKYDPTRIYAGVLELKDWRWMVTQLRVLQNTGDEPAGEFNHEPAAEPTALRLTYNAAAD